VQRKINKEDLLVSRRPDLVKEWNFEKNGDDLTPYNISYGSHKRVWWVCGKCGFEWNTTLKDRAISKSGCPRCVNQFIDETNCLLTINPELCKEWDYEKNELGPEKYSPCNSRQKVWWKCSKCGFEWKTSIGSRASGRGCSKCVGKIASDTNNLLFKRPEVCKDWNYNKNELGPENYTSQSQKIVWWVCSTCGLEHEARISDKVKSGSCKRCAGSFVDETNCLLTLKPELCEEWDYEKNELGPENYRVGNQSKVWWICSTCGFEHEASISEKTKGSCKRCVGRFVDETNSLLSLKPEVCKEWCYDRNELGPEKYTARSQKKVWWVCSICGFEWEATVNHRTVAESGCPKCSNRFVDETNCLLTLNPELCKEWDYDKNELGPDKFSLHSGQKIWWKCSKCDFEWESTINRRSSGQGCPNCVRKYSKKCHAWIDGFNNPNIGKGGWYTIEGRNFEFDGFDKTTNTIYEFYGDYWHGNPRVYNPDDKIFYGKTFGELYEKTLKREQFLISCGYKLITIWEDEWDQAVKRSKNDINQLQQQGMPEAI